MNVLLGHFPKFSLQLIFQNANEWGSPKIETRFFYIQHQWMSLDG